MKLSFLELFQILEFGSLCTDTTGTRSMHMIRISVDCEIDVIAFYSQPPLQIYVPVYILPSMKLA